MTETTHMAGASPLHVADGVTRPLDPRWISYQRRVGWVSSLVYGALFFGVATLVAMAGDLPLPLVMGAAGVAAIVRTVHSQWWPAVAYRHASYTMDDRVLEIRRGVLWRSVIDVPRSRIQHSDVSQGPFERMHGLGTLSVFTAGTSHAMVRLHGLDHDRAQSLREHLMQADEDDVI